MILATTLQFDPICTGMLFYGGLTVVLIVAILIGLKWTYEKVHDSEGQACYGVISGILLLVFSLTAALQSPGCGLGGVNAILIARDRAEAAREQQFSSSEQASETMVAQAALVAAQTQRLFAENELLKSQLAVMEFELQGVGNPSEQE